MFKLHKAKKVITATQNNRDLHANEGTVHRPSSKPRDLILTNILEEGSSVDEPRSFEQDEQYLDECLKVLDRNPEQLRVEECDIEEYDFDDYNSVASTASLLNIHAELVQEENNASTTANQRSAFKAYQSRGRVEKQTVINGTESLNSASSPHLTEQLLRNARISKVQASISKVNNWGKYGVNSVLNTDQWKESFLEAAQTGDLRRMQDAYNKLGGTSEIVIRITDSSANTALHKAAEAGNLQCLQWLTERLPNDCLRNITNQDHLTTLAVAIKYGKVHCAQWLLDDTSAADEMSNNAARFGLIQLTIQSGQDDCLKYLLSYISAKFLELDVADSAGMTLAHVAAREGHMTCLQTLVDHNIDVTTEDKDGRSPADYAYAAGQTACARYLVMEESCWLLSQRVAKLHRELKDCKEENKELKQRLEMLESRARTGMPDRPEAVGGDQSDTNSTEATKSTDGRLGTKLTDSPLSDRDRASGSPDGESPKGFGQERTAYQYHINGDHSPEHRPLSYRRLNSNGITNVKKESEVLSAGQFKAFKQHKRPGATGSIDSGGSGVSSDTAGENSTMQQVMAKQIAANTRRLVMSKHAQKVEESPLIKTKLIPVRADGVSVDEQRLKGPSLQVSPVDTYHSASSSRSHSPARTDSTSGSRPTSGTPREELSEINKIKISNGRDEKRAASEDRAGTPTRSRLFANRRKTPTFSSDSTISSDSDVERSAQRSSGPRHRRGHPSSRTKDHNTNTTGARQILRRQVPVGANRAKKTVSWNESPKDTNPTNVNRQIPTQRPRVPPKPPARTTSRDSGVSGYVQKDRIVASLNGVNRNVGRGVPSVIAQKPVKPVAEQLGLDMLTHSLDGYQQDDRPWYETDEFE